jgi:hypothetical protein
MSVDPATRSEPALANDKRRDPRAGFFAARGALLAEREDLRGVYAFADYLDDAVRWSA